MKRTLILAVAAVAAVFSASSVQAQYPLTRIGYGYGYSLYTPSYYGYYSPYYGYGYGTTAYGSYLQGRAAVIDAQGYYNYNSSLAAKNLQEARAKAIENKSAEVRTYFELREINRNAREKERGPRATQEELNALAKIGVPERLGEEQLSKVTGEIQWPELLLDMQYDQSRATLNKLFRERGYEEGGVGSAFHRDVKQLTDALKVELKKQVQKLSPSEYLAARKFLDSLAYEARFTRV